MVLTFRYRVLPSRRQHRALEDVLESQRQLYNAALEERIGAYRRGRVLSYFDQLASLTQWRKSDEDARSVPVSLQRATLKRLDGAYKGFFRRLRSGTRPGFPRFRGKGWFDSFGFTEMCGATLRGGRLRFRGLPGSLRLHMHRPLPPEAEVKSCVLRRDTRGWTIGLSVELDEAPARDGTRAVGVDLGIAHFAALSTGECIPSLAVARRNERKFRVVQRALGRKRRGSRGYRSAREALKRVHASVRRQRANCLHQSSARLVREFDVVAIEALNVKALAKSALAKEVRDASWGKFISLLRYKAARAGVRLVEVRSQDTSQICSGCGARVPKPLGIRWHHCPSCALSLDRDVNAARNILRRAGVGPGLPNVAG